MTPTPQRQQLKPSERIALIQQQANQPIHCEKCGSTWFTDVEYKQFSGNRYATTPGGDLQVVSHLNMRLRVCICGHPYQPNLGGVRPGRTASAEVSNFMDSVKAAREYLNGADKPDLTAVAEDFVTRDEYLKVVEELDALKKAQPATVTLEELEPASNGITAEEHEALLDRLAKLEAVTAAAETPTMETVPEETESEAPVRKGRFVKKGSDGK